MIWRANQSTVFYMIATLAFNESSKTKSIRLSSTCFEIKSRQYFHRFFRPTFIVTNVSAFRCFCKHIVWNTFPWCFLNLLSFCYYLYMKTNIRRVPMMEGWWFEFVVVWGMVVCVWLSREGTKNVSLSWESSLQREE